jgi:excisionase family DNA binding protein
VTEPNPDILNELEAAAYLRVSRGVLRRLRRQRLIPHWRLGPQTIRYSKKALDAWAEQALAAGGGGQTGGATTEDHHAPQSTVPRWKGHR